MPVNQPRDAIVIALDVGKSVSVLHDYEEKTFFESSRNCVSWIIQRKIISQSVDVLSLLLIGSEDSGSLPVGNGYDNICGKFDFQLASWDMLNFIEKEVKTSNVESDWLGALIVATEMLRAYEEFNNVSSKKIVLFSDFSKPMTDDIDGIIRRIKSLNIEVTIIGPEHLYFPALCDDDDSITDDGEIKKKKSKKSLERQEGEKIAYHLWKELPENVGICTFESALKQLCSYAPKSKRVTPWNCIMDIGDVNINISVVKKTDPKPAKKFNTKFSKPTEQRSGEGSSAEGSAGTQATAPTMKDTVMYYKHETGQLNEFVDVQVKQDDTVEGYRYGKTIIPFTEEDKSAMKYETGAKCFSVLCFAPVSSVPYYFLSGECSYLVVPREKDKNAEVALSALIQGLKRTKCLAIVRRVYGDNRGLSLGILHPTVEEIFSEETNDITCGEHLLFIELAFEDDVKSVDFPSLESVVKSLTRQQYDAVDNLIDGMNLMKADKGLRGEECEAFDLPYLHDYKEQFFHYCVIQKGLHPEKPLPTSLPPYIENFIKVPKGVEEKCETAFGNLKALFKIKKCSDGDSDPAKRWKGSKISKEDVNRSAPFDFPGPAKFEHFTDSFIKEEKNPVTRSWMRLFAQGFPTEDELDKLFNAYSDASELEVSQSSSSFGVVLSQIRASYLKKDPTSYNEWMIGFKKYLAGRDGLGHKIWEVIVTEHIRLIINEENKMSKLSTEDAEKFLCSDLNRASTPEKQTSNFLLLDELLEEQMNVDFDS